MARKYHPDRSDEPDADSKFKEAQEAYAVLSDSQKDLNTIDTDMMGHKDLEDSVEAGFNINIEDLFGGDIFSSFFGGGSSRFGKEEIGEKTS